MTTKSKIASFALAACLATGGLIASQSVAQGGPVGGNGQVKSGGKGPKTGGGKGDHREKHPEIMKAIRNLEQAKNDLQHADRDFGGHRTKAVQATELAIAECREALKFDKN